MAKRENHYEAAFEAYLRHWRVPYVAVDEARRSRWAGGSIKSLDFIVSPPGRLSWLVDVKGRRFPSGEQKHYWKNWSTRDDLVSMARWERLFGERFGGLFVFAYNVVGELAPLAADELFEFRGGLYGFVAIRVREYGTHARPISTRWDTLAMPAAPFRQLAAPVSSFLFDERTARPATASVSVRNPCLSEDFA
jgi:hypothetical protein